MESKPENIDDPAAPETIELGERVVQETVEIQPTPTSKEQIKANWHAKNPEAEDDLKSLEGVFKPPLDKEQDA